MSPRRSAPTPGERLTAQLSGAAPREVSSAELDVDLTGMVVGVEGVGELTGRLTPSVIRRLLTVAEPAPFGLGTQTIMDERIRHTWQIPTGVVDVDWAGQERTVLDAARTGLGLSDDSAVRAELHSLLVYGKGQFFAPHWDSEKADAMVATLVVTLPTRHTGGELVVQDADGTDTYRASADVPTAVVLYADRVHEVRPVRSGHRVSLTFTILVEQGPDPDLDTDEVTVISRLLDRYFAAALPGRWSGEQVEPPLRYAFLLDHEYTQRGLSWSRLKGVDAQRAGLLRAGIERLGGQAVLALTTIHETWDADVDSRGRGWGWRERDDDADEVELGSLIDEEIALSHWLHPGQRAAQPVDLAVDARETGAATPTRALQPYQSEYEGYMGNYGNTVDRWYRRAAVLVWPDAVAFANRAEADVVGAVDELVAAVELGRHDQAASQLASIASLWPALVRGAGGSALLPRVLGLAAALDAESARTLLGPFGVGDLRPTVLPQVHALARARGSAWVAALIGRWHERPSRHAPLDDTDWLDGLPVLAAGLREMPAVADALVTPLWDGRASLLATLAAAAPTSFQRRQLDAQVAPVAAVLRASVEGHRPDLTARIVAALTTPASSIAVTIGVARSAMRWPEPVREAGQVEALVSYAVQQLRAELAAPPRAADDWSLTEPLGCTCGECARLASFMADPDERVLVWPLAQRGRDHVTATARAVELPVRVETRTSGRPYSLVLTKTSALFDRERSRRAAAQDELVELVALLARWASDR